jgi:hypothetical protein
LSASFRGVIVSGGGNNSIMGELGEAMNEAEKPRLEPGLDEVTLLGE